MNAKQQKLMQHLHNMNYNVNVESIENFSSNEKFNLERIAERMSYLYTKLVNDRLIPENKRSLMKDEFKALQWVLYEFEIINDQKRTLTQTSEKEATIS